MIVSWNNCSKEFAPDGALRDIQVVDADATDWQLVVDFLRSNAADLRYTIDGVPAPLPKDSSSILATRKTASPTLLFRWSGIEIASHFFGEDDLEFDFRPQDVRSQRELELLASFVTCIGRLLHKSVVVYHEGWEMSPFLLYDHESDDVRYVPPTPNQGVQ